MKEDERITTKKTELLQIFETLPECKLKVAADLINQAAFVAVTLEDLAEAIQAEGVTEEYTNGSNQAGRKISSNAKMYATLIGKYTSITTKLLALVPEAETMRQKDAEAKELRRQIAELEKEKQFSRRDHDNKAREYLKYVEEGKLKSSDYFAFMYDYLNKEL